MMEHVIELSRTQRSTCHAGCVSRPRLLALAAYPTGGGEAPQPSHGPPAELPVRRNRPDLFTVTPAHTSRMAQGGRMVEEFNPDFITANERYFLYFLLSAGFLFIIWMKREAISDTRNKVKELGAKLKAIDRPIEVDNWRDMVPPGSYY